MKLSNFDRECIEKAIAQALEAEKAGNLPIGAVIALDGEVIAEGRNAIWKPETSLSRHAEMEAMRKAPAEFWERSADMTLFTTLEPCVMCLGAILLHGIGRVLYGSSDPFGGGITVVCSLPVFFARQFSRSVWLGPALPEKCDKLYARIKEMERMEDVFGE